jgi:hypothetical protein
LPTSHKGSTVQAFISPTLRDYISSKSLFPIPGTNNHMHCAVSLSCECLILNAKYKPTVCSCLIPGSVCALPLIIKPVMLHNEKLMSHLMSSCTSKFMYSYMWFSCSFFAFAWSLLSCSAWLIRFAALFMLYHNLVLLGIRYFHTCARTPRNLTSWPSLSLPGARTSKCLISRPSLSFPVSFPVI